MDAKVGPPPPQIFPESNSGTITHHKASVCRNNLENKCNGFPGERRDHLAKLLASNLLDVSHRYLR